METYSHCHQRNTLGLCFPFTIPRQAMRNLIGVTMSLNIEEEVMSCLDLLGAT